MSYNSISFGTSCMGRLNHLRQTYIHNIETALSVDRNSKFVLLNYNSQDGMHEWVQNNLSTHIQKGTVKYLHTSTPQQFSQSHTKNITSKHADADIVCLLDADHFLTKYYVQQNLLFFNQDPDSHKISRPKAEGGKGGRIVFEKKDFLEIGGFDERMKGWGHEDTDFYYRFTHYFDNVSEITPDIKEESIIQHDDDSRNSNSKLTAAPPIHSREEFQKFCSTMRWHRGKARTLGIDFEEYFQLHGPRIINREFSVRIEEKFNKTKDFSLMISNKNLDWGKLS